MPEMITLSYFTRLEIQRGSQQALRLEKTYSIAHPKSVVWQSILDPDLLAEILPGCKSLKPLGSDQYVAEIEIKIGPVKGRYDSELQILDKIPMEGYSFNVSGIGSKGHMAGDGTVRLTEEDGATVLSFSAKGNVGGLLARVGQRLIEAAGKKLMDQGFANFEKKLAEVEYA